MVERLEKAFQMGKFDLWMWQCRQKTRSIYGPIVFMAGCLTSWQLRDMHFSTHTHIQKPNVARIPSCRQFSPNSNQQGSLSDFIIRSTHTKWEFKLQTNQIYFRKYSLTYFTNVVNYVMRISRRPVVQPRIYESETIYHLISTILEMEQSSSLFEHVKI